MVKKRICLKERMSSAGIVSAWEGLEVSGGSNRQTSLVGS